MIEERYLEKGICALSRAHTVNAMVGHLGAALVAGYLFSEDHPDLPEPIHAGMQGEMDRVLRGESVFDPGRAAAITADALFAPQPAEAPDEGRTEELVDALDGNIERPRSSGHNVIFTSLAVRALQRHPSYATPSVIDGLLALVHKFDRISAGSGDYGPGKGRIDGNDVVLEDDDTHPYADLLDMADVVLDELIETAGVRKQGFGGLHHLVNHAAGLADLAETGYKTVARRGLESHRTHLRLLRSLPDVGDELPEDRPSELNPWNPAYWNSETLTRHRAHLTHRIKTVYGFSRLAPLVSDSAKVERARDSLRLLM